MKDRSLAPERSLGTRTRVRWPSWWAGLSSWSRVSFVGLLGAAVLALGLGVFIPRQVERHMLHAQAESNRQVLGALLGTQILPSDDLASGFADLDRFVNTSIVRGDFVRVKLWSPEGRILYSDDRRLVGRYFPPSSELRRALGGQAQSAVSDLSDPENRLEQVLAHRLLEFYLPVERGGRVVAVWEVYQSLDRFEAQLAKVRLAVWASVATGLAVLLVFLVSSFGSLLAAVQQRRRDAEQRSRELGALLEVSRAVSASLDPDRLSRAAVHAIRRQGGFRAVALVRRSEEGSRSKLIAASRESSCPALCVIQTGGRPHPRAPGCASLSVELGGAPSGLALIACRDRGRGFAPEDRALLETAGKQVRIAFENAGLYESLHAARDEQRRLMSRLVSAHEDERKRIVGEIHDGLGQDLHRVLFGLRGCRSSPAGEVTDEMGRLESVVDGSIHRLRRLLQELRPSTLEDVGLAASVRGLADRVRREDGIMVDVLGDRGISPEPPLPVRLAAFRIVQEALRNVVRHSSAGRALVEFGREDGVLTVRVADRGRGLPPELGDGLGLWLMRERAEALGGTLSVDSGEWGTSVSARIPVETPP